MYIILYPHEIVFFCIRMHLCQESSDGEDLESGPDDLSMEDSHQEDDGLLDPPITHRVALDSHWAMPSSRLGHTPHHHHHHGSSSRSISRPGSSAAR